MEIGKTLSMNNLLQGFEITVNKNKTIAAVHDGSVLVALTCEYGIDIAGGDDKLGISLQWDKANLQKGDKVKIVATDINEITTPICVEDKNR